MKYYNNIQKSRYQNRNVDPLLHSWPWLDDSNDDGVFVAMSRILRTCICTYTCTVLYSHQQETLKEKSQPESCAMKLGHC